mgnify:CR=1 FL=1
MQGITGRDGGFHATKMKAYGTNVVGGTSPGKAGQEVSGIPVFNTVRDAVEATQANTSVIFVPAAFAKDAMMEAADAGIQLIICITEGVPTLDVVQAYNYIRQKGAKLIGPNCPGLISPEESMVGIMKEYLPMNGIPMMTLFTVGTLLPTVGVAILCKQVITKPLDWVTFAFGFILAGALGLNLIVSAVVAVFFAVLNYQLQQAKNVRLAAAASGNVSADDEEEEDI